MNYELLIQQAKQEGFSDIEVTISENKSLTIALFNSKVDKNEFSQTRQIAIRAIYNEKMAYLDLENEDETIPFILNNLKENAKVLTTDEKFSIFAGSKTYPQVRSAENDFEQHTGLEKISLLQRVEKQVKTADERIVFVPYCHYNEQVDRMTILNSKGLHVSKENASCAIILQAVAKEKEDSQSGFDIQVKHNFSQFDVDEICTKVVELAVAMLNAKPVPSKFYPIVIENRTMSSLLASFQSIFSGEAAIKKITPFLKKENEQIMSEKISIIDDPLKEDAIYVHPFDDEGVACYKKAVVEKGVFKTFLHNLKTAQYFHTTSTGNGFKMGNSIGAYGSNLYIEPGDSSYDELLGSMQEGLLITELAGLHAGLNPISGDFSLKASGFLVLEGKKSRPVTLIVAAGNFFKMMNEVEKVANDLYLPYSGTGSPSILFKGLAISGE